MINKNRTMDTTDSCLVDFYNDLRNPDLPKFNTFYRDCKYKRYGFLGEIDYDDLQIFFAKPKYSSYSYETETNCNNLNYIFQKYGVLSFVLNEWLAMKHRIYMPIEQKHFVEFYNNNLNYAFRDLTRLNILLCNGDDNDYTFELFENFICHCSDLHDLSLCKKHRMQILMIQNYWNTHTIFSLLLILEFSQQQHASNNIELLFANDYLVMLISRYVNAKHDIKNMKCCYVDSSKQWRPMWRISAIESFGNGLIYSN